MPPAARVTDSTAHGGTLSGTGVPSVLIGGQPAAVLGTSHVCAVTQHATNTVAGGSASVFIGGMPAARVGDRSLCQAPINSGCSTVLIGG